MRCEEPCFQCGRKGTEHHGHTICDSCLSKLGLYADETIRKHRSLHQSSKQNRTYEEEIQYRLRVLEADYIKKRIKLLHIEERLKHIE